MPLPPSFSKDGFTPEAAAAKRSRVRMRNGQMLKPVLVGVEGESDSGKTEFILSCPAPGIAICVDRMYDGVLDNPEPPPSRQDDWVIYPIQVPLNQSATQSEYQIYHAQVRDTFYKALNNPDALSVALDGDSDWWELHRLAAFGKLANVWPQTRYGDVYAQKRAITNRAWDSGKVIIATNKLRPEYETVTDENGLPVKETDGSDKKAKTGRLVRQGFSDTDYLWQIQIRMLFEAEKVDAKGKTIPKRYGMRIIKCKHNRDLVGCELWGDESNFAGLMTVCYPEIDLARWGL